MGFGAEMIVRFEVVRVVVEVTVIGLGMLDGRVNSGKESWEVSIAVAFVSGFGSCMGRG